MTTPAGGLRVLCLEWIPSARNGGMELSMFDQCVELVKLGHEVTLGYRAPSDLLDRYHAAGVRTVRLSNYELDRAAPLRSGAEWLGGLARALRVPADVVVAGSYYMTMFGAAVARLKRIPLVCHLRLLPPARSCGQWDMGGRRVTRFIAVSAAARDAWVRLTGFEPARFDVVHDGVDLERFRPGDDRAATRAALGVPQDAFVVLYAGRLDRDKNLEGLLRAFAALGLSSDRARLLVAGRPVDHPSPEAGAAYADELRALAESLGVGGQVHWLGSRDDVPSLYRAADVAALFTIEREALARTAYEAMACGIPAVAARVGGMPEVLSGEFSRFLFDREHPEGAAELLRSLVGWQARDPRLAGRLRRHALAGFSKEAMVRGIEQSLRRALAERVVPRRAAAVTAEGAR